MLENEEFSHQVEPTPAFSERATRAYLAAKVRREQGDDGEPLWVAQRAAAVRNESSWLIHRLSRAFYYRLNEVLVAHRLELTRIVPLIVPLQLELERLAPDPATPLLLAVEAGDATAVIAGRSRGEILFSRTTHASFRGDPSRVAVEINRSLLYAKQQYGAVVEHAFLLGASAGAARSEVEARCGPGKRIVAREASAEDWLRLVAAVPAGHPVNLVADHRRRTVRNRLVRAAVIGLCWAGLGLAGVNAWSSRLEWREELAGLEALARSEESLLAEREEVLARNAAAERDRALVAAIVDAAPPPVPGRFVAYLSGLVPEEMRLTEAVVRLEPDGGWSMRIEGVLEADEETLQLTVDALRRRLARGPFAVRVAATVQPAGVVMIGGGSSRQRFNLEGRLFEK